MRLAVVVFLILGMLAAGATVDMSAPSRTRVPAIELRGTPLPEAAPPVLPTTPAKPEPRREDRPASARPASSPADVPTSDGEPDEAPSSGSESPASAPPDSATDAGDDETTPGPGSKGSKGDTDDGPSTPVTRPTPTKPPQVGPTIVAGAAPAPVLPPERAGDDGDDDDGEDDDDEDDDDDDDGDDG
jgi:hypothetical protein